MDLSIIIPIFNEKNDIFPRYQKLRDVLLGNFESYELIYIDNCSTDSSLDLLRVLQKKDQHLKIVALDKNYGKPPALAIGFTYARGDKIFTMDTDFKLVCEDLLRAIVELKDTDAIFFTEDYTAWHLAGYQRKCLEALKLYKGFYKFMPSLLEIYGCCVKQVYLKESLGASGKIKHRSLRCSLKDIFGILVIRWMKANRLKYKIVK